MSKGNTTVLAGTIITVLATVLSGVIAFAVNSTVGSLEASAQQNHNDITNVVNNIIPPIKSEADTAAANYASILIAQQSMDKKLDIVISKIK